MVGGRSNTAANTHVGHPTSAPLTGTSAPGLPRDPHVQPAAARAAGHPDVTTHSSAAEVIPPVGAPQPQHHRPGIPLQDRGGGSDGARGAEIELQASSSFVRDEGAVGGGGDDASHRRYFAHRDNSHNSHSFSEVVTEARAAGTRHSSDLQHRQPVPIATRVMADRSAGRQTAAAATASAKRQQFAYNYDNARHSRLSPSQTQRLTAVFHGSVSFVLASSLSFSLMSRPRVCGLSAHLSLIHI